MTSQPGAYGDLLYRGDELVVVRSLAGLVTCPDWTADVSEFAHLMFLNAVLSPDGKIYASGKANQGAAVVIVGPDKFKTVIPGGYGNYPSQMAVVNGEVVCYVVLNLTEYAIFNLSGKMLGKRDIPEQYHGTSQGIRFIGDNGAVYWGDQTMAGIFEGLVIREWMQRRGYTGGQGQDGGFGLSGNGVSTLYPSGNTFFPRIAVNDTRLALLYINNSMVYWDTLTLPLEVAPPKPLPAPKISVVSYDKILKTGEPWTLEFSSVDTRFLVTKDAKDRLWIEAQNAAGSDRTGSVRQLTIEGPLCPPCPEYTPMLKRFWLQPNLGSLDQAQILDSLANVDVVSIPIQQILTDVSTPQLGPNTYPNLAAAGFFKRLAELGKPLIVEMGSVKDGNCRALNSINEVQVAVQRVTDAGGVIAGFSADEPLTNSRGCHQSMEATADGHANWTHAIRALGPMQVGWLEGWPDYTTLADLETFMHLLDQRGAVPEYFHADIYHDHSTDTKTRTFIKGCQDLCSRYNVTFGLFVNSTKDPIATDAAHDLNLRNLATKLYAMYPSAAHVHVAAWAHRVKDDTTHKTQNVPNNLGTHGLLETFAAVRTIFKDVAPPIPPNPEPEVNLMNYKLVDYVLHIKGTKPSSAGGKVNVIMLDDTVASIQPGGEFETRAPGADGAYEQAYDRGNLLLYESVPPNPSASNYRWAVAYRVTA